jgi:hypothetical protein
MKIPDEILDVIARICLLIFIAGILYLIFK